MSELLKLAKVVVSRDAIVAEYKAAEAEVAAFEKDWEETRRKFAEREQSVRERLRLAVGRTLEPGLAEGKLIELIVAANPELRELDLQIKAAAQKMVERRAMVPGGDGIEQTRNALASAELRLKHLEQEQAGLKRYMTDERAAIVPQIAKAKEAVAELRGRLTFVESQAAHYELFEKAQNEHAALAARKQMRLQELIADAIDEATAEDEDDASGAEAA